MNINACNPVPLFQRAGAYALDTLTHRPWSLAAKAATGASVAALAYFTGNSLYTYAAGAALALNAVLGEKRIGSAILSTARNFPVTTVAAIGMLAGRMITPREYTWCHDYHNCYGDLTIERDLIPYIFLTGGSVAVDVAVLFQKDKLIKAGVEPTFSNWWDSLPH